MEKLRRPVHAIFAIIYVKIFGLCPHDGVPTRFKDHQRIACAIGDVSDPPLIFAIEQCVISNRNDKRRQKLSSRIPPRLFRAMWTVISWKPLVTQMLVLWRIPGRVVVVLME